MCRGRPGVPHRSVECGLGGRKSRGFGVLKVGRMAVGGRPSRKPVNIKSLAVRNQGLTWCSPAVTKVTRIQEVQGKQCR